MENPTELTNKIRYVPKDMSNADREALTRLGYVLLDVRPELLKNNLPDSDQSNG